MPGLLLTGSQSDYLIQFLIQIHILNAKQCRFGSVGFWRPLIWIFTVCKDRAYPGLARPRLRSNSQSSDISVTHLLLSLRKHAYSNILRILPSKNEKFQIKNSDIFLISAQNMDCGYSLEPPRRGGSNEYPQSMLLSRNKKNNVYPCKPQFYYIKVGFKGVEII